MKRIALWVAVLGLLGLIARPAYALWVLVHLAPQNTTFTDADFRIQSKDVDDLKEFTVTITQKAGTSPLPEPYAKLSVNTPHDHLAQMLVAGERDETKMTYRFRVSPQTLPNSTLEVSVPRFAREPGKVEIMGGGTIYQMKLQDFVAPGQK